MFHSSDTIVAQATAQGRAGIGIVRISGSNALPIARRILKCDLIPRVATYQPFFDEHNAIIDQGIALYFPNPNSFTGEDVLELQGHGSVVVLDLLMKHILATGLARLAQPGEFSQRAFLNDKLDLAQAEAIADLINASSEQAVRSAIRTLQGHFSQTINQLWDTLVALRVYVEAAIDFPDEEIDFLSNGHVQGRLETLLDQIVQVEAKTKQGTLIRDGMTLVIAGKPNAGKSSLLNALAGRERAIVTDIAGTTRDTLTEYIHLDGMPLHLIDTAGLRETDDIVEKIGVQRAWEAIRGADQVLLIVDSTQEKDIDPNKLWPEFTKQLPAHVGLTLVRNKIDLLEDTTHTQTTPPHVIAVSAKTGEGLATLTESLKACMGYQPSNEGQFIARRRHLQALNQAKQHIQAAQKKLLGYQAGELVAEELRIAADCLGEITGKMNADELLGEIFSNFCIGK